MYGTLVADNGDERAVLSLVLQRAGLAVTAASDLERAMKTWFERPADLIVFALESDPIAHARRVRVETPAPLVVVVDPVRLSISLSWKREPIR